jgi:hypothetical protein
MSGGAIAPAAGRFCGYQLKGDFSVISTKPMVSDKSQENPDLRPPNNEGHGSGEK